METFKLSPIGDVKITLYWGIKEIETESGKKKYIRTRIHPQKTYSFSVGGLDPSWFVSFYKRVKGASSTFIFNYDGFAEECRLTEGINYRCCLENKKCVAWSCDVTLVVENGKTDYGENDRVLFHPRPDTKTSFNYQVGTVSLGQKNDYYLKSDIPKRTISGKWSGLKRDRDKLLSLFYEYCKSPVSFTFNGEDVSVLLPDKLEVTDHREEKTIVGFECQMELEVVNG